MYNEKRISFKVVETAKQWINCLLTSGDVVRTLKGGQCQSVLSPPQAQSLLKLGGDLRTVCVETLKRTFQQQTSLGVFVAGAMDIHIETIRPL